MAAPTSLGAAFNVLQDAPVIKHGADSARWHVQLCRWERVHPVQDCILSVSECVELVLHVGKRGVPAPIGRAAVSIYRRLAGCRPERILTGCPDLPPPARARPPSGVGVPHQCSRADYRLLRGVRATVLCVHKLVRSLKPNFAAFWHKRLVEEVCTVDVDVVKHRLAIHHLRQGRNQNFGKEIPDILLQVIVVVVVRGADDCSTVVLEPPFWVRVPLGSKDRALGHFQLEEAASSLSEHVFMSA